MLEMRQPQSFGWLDDLLKSSCRWLKLTRLAGNFLLLRKLLPQPQKGFLGSQTNNSHGATAETILRCTIKYLFGPSDPRIDAIRASFHSQTPITAMQAVGHYSGVPQDEPAREYRIPL